MKVAVASQENASVSKHFGRSNCFIVFDLEGGVIVGEDVRPYASDGLGTCEAEIEFHNRSDGYGELVELLIDCKVVLCRGMGWRAAEELVRSGINPMVIDGELSPREAVQQYIDGKLKPAAGFCRCHR